MQSFPFNQSLNKRCIIYIKWYNEYHPGSVIWYVSQVGLVQDNKQGRNGGINIPYTSEVCDWSCTLAEFPVPTPCVTHRKVCQETSDEGTLPTGSRARASPRSLPEININASCPKSITPHNKFVSVNSSKYARWLRPRWHELKIPRLPQPRGPSHPYVR